MTPKEIAEELKVSAKQVRRVLRKGAGTLKLQARGLRWELTEDEVSTVRKHFAKPEPAKN